MPSPNKWLCYTDIVLFPCIYHVVRMVIYGMTQMLWPCSYLGKTTHSKYAAWITVYIVNSFCQQTSDNLKLKKGIAGNII